MYRRLGCGRARVRCRLAISPHREVPLFECHIAGLCRLSRAIRLTFLSPYPLRPRRPLFLVSPVRKLQHVDRPSSVPTTRSAPSAVAGAAPWRPFVAGSVEVSFCFTAGSLFCCVHGFRAFIRQPYFGLSFFFAHAFFLDRPHER
jgi:hypothetical protein